MRKKDLFCAAFVMILLSGCSEFEWNPEFSGCGNRLIEIHEQCDDGNKKDGDGCSDKCQIEEGWYFHDGKLQSMKCGNSVMDPGEQCDDGNQDAGDGCSEQCQIERGYECPHGLNCAKLCGNGTVDPGEQCDKNTKDSEGCSEDCLIKEGWYLKTDGLHEIKCGNGMVDPNEQCDDDNTNDGDGCSHECKLEEGWYLKGNILHHISCGNGVRDTGEQCDFAREQDKDGCTDACQVKNGWYFNQAQALVEIECGNGTLDPGEQCDDGDTDDDNGCSRTCRVEEGWICSADGVCIKLPGHGNSQLDYGEECDDGNFNFGDGCTPNGKLEPFYTLIDGQAVPQCGDGLTIAPETCDDGNLNSGDGCSETCQIEESYDCTNGVITEEDKITPYLPIIIRDFRKGGSHSNHTAVFTEELLEQYPPICGFKKNHGLPEFGTDSTSCDSETSKVMQYLNENEKPYITEKTACYACPESLEMWYQDVEGLNKKHLHTLYQTDYSQTNRFVYDYKNHENTLNNLVSTSKDNIQMKITNNYFLPLGAETWTFYDITLDGKEDGKNIGNFYFTVEAKGYFKYEPDTKIIVDADDSLWIFINGQLAIDLGGTHGVQGDITRIFPADDDLTLTINHEEVTYKYNQDFNLIEGQYYPIHIFYAERGCCGSGLKLDTPLIYSPSICKPK